MNSFSRDAMQISSRNGCIDMLEMLYLRGGSVASRGLKGDTLFHLAAYNGHVDTMKWLQNKGS
jgi:ankyrin repeat protein